MAFARLVRTVRLGGTLAAILLGTLSPVRAEPPNANLPTPVVMVVDPQAVMQQSKAGQGIRVAHDKYREKFQAELDAIQKKLTEAGNELAKEKSVLSQEAWQKKARAFDHRVFEFNQRYQGANLAVEKSYRAAMNDLGRAFAQVTAQVASEVGANLVLPIQQVVLHDPQMDMTKTVIQRMDAKYPSVPFPVPVIEKETVSTGPDKDRKK